MRRVLAVVLSVVAVLAFVAPAAHAQAPAAKVTINGLVDNITSYIRNLSTGDANYSRARDTEWYARTRVRPDITGEVGTTKFVLGIEIDASWGQVGATDVGGFRSVSGGWDLNTDVIPQFETKWAYTEFDMPGVPFATRVRLGAQPWATAYKAAVLAQGDFAGVNLVSTFTPAIKWHFAYAQVEEESTGAMDGFTRGDDWAIVTSLEVTPFKGFDLRPIFSIFHATGTTSGSPRIARGGQGVGDPGAAGATIGALNTFATPYSNQTHETRYTVGIDSRLRMGPFSIDPTILWQTGDRDIVSPFTNRIEDQNLNAWLVDIRGGFQTGPLLLEAAFAYSTGNSANSDVRKGGTTINYFQPISTDSGYYGTWAEHSALNIDYFGMYSWGASSPGAGIGYDKYGLIRLGGRASYAITPAFTVRTALTVNWAAEEVDNRGVRAAATGITPCRQSVAGPTGGTCPRDVAEDRYLSTELDLGFQWRFAPGLALDVVGAYSWLGEAMEHRLSTGLAGGALANTDIKDVQSVHVRLRYNF